MTDACHFLNRWLSLLPIPTMTGACHFFQIQKWQVAVIFVEKNDTYLSFFFTRKNRRWDPHVFRGGAQTHFQTSVTTPEPPMFLEGGLRNKSKMAQIEPNLSPPSKNMGGSGVVTDVWKWVWAPPLKTWGAQRRVLACEKKWQASVIFGFQKMTANLSFLDFKKMTGAWHFWILQKWQPPVTVWLLKKMTGACHLLIFCKKRRT